MSIEYNRNLISYFELSTEWQKEARSNSDNYEELTYVEPLKEHVAGQHVLLDLEDCMICSHPDYDGVMSCTNSTAIAINISPCTTMCKLTFL